MKPEGAKGTSKFIEIGGRVHFFFVSVWKRNFLFRTFKTLRIVSLVSNSTNSVILNYVLRNRNILIKCKQKRILASFNFRQHKNIIFFSDLEKLDLCRDLRLFHSSHPLDLPDDRVLRGLVLRFALHADQLRKNKKIFLILNIEYNVDQVQVVLKIGFSLQTNLNFVKTTYESINHKRDSNIFWGEKFTQQ